MRRAHLLALLLPAAACMAPDGPGSAPAPEVVAVTDLGLVRNASLSSVLRDGGAGGRVGGKVLWTFGDTLFPFKAADGTNARSNSGAYADFAAPTTLSEDVDAKGAPLQLLPFTAEEAAYNTASGRPDERYALWPTAVIPKGENALILYTRLKVHPGALNYEDVSTGFAEVEPWKTVAERRGEVFQAPEPPFHHAAALDAGDLYLYACATDGRCKVARAPYGDALQRAAYGFWTGSGWSPNVADAVASIPGGTTGFSVAYDTHLEQFVSFASAPFTGRISMRTSARPEGPWSPPIGVTDVGVPIYATTLHFELMAEAGRKLYVSYYKPLADFKGELHLLEITLR